MAKAAGVWLPIALCGRWGIVVDPPRLDRVGRFGERAEQILIQTFVAKLAVEGLDEAFCVGLPGAM